MKARWFFYALCLFVSAGFVWGVVQLFEIRFARGDVYPAYSTLRSDPLGAKAFYESLVRLDQMQLSRNERPLDQFRAARGTTLFLLGVHGFSASEKTIVRLEQFVKGGGRLVVAFYPQSMETSLTERDEEKTPSPSPSVSPNEEFVKVLFTRDIARRWEFKLGTKEQLIDNTAHLVNFPGVDPEISWHSALHFKDSAPIWKNVYRISEFPVVLERSFGNGTIVLAGDSYFLSNEAMRLERHAAFLAWLAGASRQIVFDETHLGIRENPDVSTLMRRYRLGGLLAGLFVLGVLVVWKNGARILPAIETGAATDEAATGKDSFAGFANLLRRHVAAPELLKTCVDEWEKLLPQKLDKSKAQIARARRILEEFGRDDVAAYREISRAISTKWKPLA